MPNIISLPRVARLLEMDRQALVDLATRAQGMYHTQVIQVGRKQRVIDIPRPELKAVQRSLHDRVLSTIPVSGSVYSIAGKGVVDNAKRHLGQSHLAILDIQACFPTITPSMVRQALLSAGFDELAIRYITPLVTVRGCLPQGPPSSPSIMNIVLRDIDLELELLAAKAGVVYTRYMDDLCFSAAEDLHALAIRGKAILRKHGFATNALKNRVWGPSDPHSVTKIIVTTELNARPEFVQAIAAEMNRLAVGTNLLTVPQIRGRIAWVCALNASLGASLLKRWNRILGSTQVRRRLRNTRKQRRRAHHRRDARHPVYEESK
jgi:hypothetical protein